MSVYYCNRCDQMRDGNFTEAVDEPGSEYGEMCCLSCLTEEETEAEQKFQDDAYKSRREAFVKKMEAEHGEEQEEGS